MKIRCYEFDSAFIKMLFSGKTVSFKVTEGMLPDDAELHNAGIGRMSSEHPGRLALIFTSESYPEYKDDGAMVKLEHMTFENIQSECLTTDDKT